MHKEFLMGNQAIAYGAVAAGVNLVSGYPGTPSTEVLETVAKIRTDDTYVEWSVNEKAALEVAAGAAYAGARTLVTMKQVGLNVAADPLMSLEYVGIKGGMVILVADDPGPISSQTEQDTRTFAMFSKVPVFDPSDPFEAYNMIQEAFSFSEEYKTPVFLRSTTRVSHGYMSLDIKDRDEYYKNTPEGFVKDSKRWVIFPKLSLANHEKIENRNELLKDVLSDSHLNFILGDTSGKKKGIATGGVSFTYVKEVLKDRDDIPVLKIGTEFPFPEKLAADFMENLDEVLVMEELDPVIERGLIYTAGKTGLKIKVRGKLSGDAPKAGEYTIDIVKKCINAFTGSEEETNLFDISDAPDLPVRPPVLCAGCPHRASFYAVKKAMAGKKTLFAGDIGCYTLGNAMPLDMVDTCLCMGAGINIAQGIYHIEKDTKAFAFVGDSTFFSSGITGVVNAVYNQADLTLIVLDNSTTAMTGHQPHPGTGETMMGEIVSKVSIENILRGIGLDFVETVDPLQLYKAIDVVKRAAEKPGVKAIIFKSPCIALVPPEKPYCVDQDKCIKCKKCIRELGCPAIINDNGHISIDKSLCTGCGLCSQVCPVDAIRREG